jgi:hypothetical protein
MLARQAGPPTRLAALLGETFVRPTQWQTAREVSADSRSVRALYARMLWGALVEAGLAPGHGRPRPALRMLAQRWLAGELEAEVALPVDVVCTMLRIDAGVLAAAVRARVPP